MPLLASLHPLRSRHCRETEHTCRHPPLFVHGCRLVVQLLGVGAVHPHARGRHPRVRFNVLADRQILAADPETNVQRHSGELEYFLETEKQVEVSATCQTLL